MGRMTFEKFPGFLDLGGKSDGPDLVVAYL